MSRHFESSMNPHGMDGMWNLFFDPVTIGLVVSGVSAATGLIGAVGAKGSGDKATANNEALEAEQKRRYDMEQVQRQQAVSEAQNFANSVQKSQYDKMASGDFSKAMQDVANAMQSRGLGMSSTAAMSALGTADVDLRSQYGKQYLNDRAGAQANLQGAMNAQAGQSFYAPIGYNPNPYAGVGTGLEAAMKGASSFGNPRPANPSTPSTPSTGVVRLGRG